MKKILIIDDDVYIGDMLTKVLQKEGYGVYRAYSGTEALLLLSQITPDIILLDLMLPGLSGEDVLPKIKNIPVIVLSAKNDVTDKVKLLVNGAADYMTKPFDTRELLARISVQLRNRPAAKTDKKIRFEELCLDPSAHEVTVAGQNVRLTKTEFAILKLLMRHPTQVITQAQILDRISEDTPDCTESSLKVHVSNLRKKLHAHSDREYIESVWGIGFKMHES